MFWASLYNVILRVKFPHRPLGPFHLISIQIHIKRHHKKKTIFFFSFLVARTIPSLSQKPERIDGLGLHGSIQGLSYENNPSCSHHEVPCPSLQPTRVLSVLDWKLHYSCTHSFLSYAVWSRNTPKAQKEGAAAPPGLFTTSVGAAQALCPRSRCIKATVQFLPKEMLVETPVTCNRHKRGTSNLPNYNNKYQENLGESWDGPIF